MLTYLLRKFHKGHMTLLLKWLKFNPYGYMQLQDRWGNVIFVWDGGGHLKVVGSNVCMEEGERYGVKVTAKSQPQLLTAKLSSGRN